MKGSPASRLLTDLARMPEDAIEWCILGELARKSFAHFVRLFWPLFHPSTPLRWGWHLDAICDHLEAVTRGDIKDLVINLPPGFSKSYLTAVFWPAWVWASSPSHQWITATHSLKLTIRDAVRCRTLLESEQYRRAFRPSWGLRDVSRETGDVPEWEMSNVQNAKMHFENTARGARYAVASGGSTGWRADTRVIDDPLSVRDRYSRAKRESVIEWYAEEFFNRKNDMATSATVLIMQRLHRDDLSGYLLREEGFEHLNLPNEFESDRVCVTSIGWKDPRTRDGELLAPNLFGPEDTQAAKRRPSVYRTQYQQVGLGTSGHVFKREWFRYWTTRPLTDEQRLAGWVQITPDMKKAVVDGKAKAFAEVAQTWDMTFGSKSSSASWVCGQVWARLGAMRFLLDETRGRWQYPVMRRAFTALCARYPHARRKLVENKALGPAILQELGSKIGGIIAIEPREIGDKQARAEACTVDMESGQVILPDPIEYPWVSLFLEEVCDFPESPSNDRVDTMSQLLNYWVGKTGSGQLLIGSL